MTQSDPTIDWDAAADIVDTEELELDPDQLDKMVDKALAYKPPQKKAVKRGNEKGMPKRNTDEQGEQN